ncbi:MAG: acylphosphatase [Cytophagales bacterium]|nr:acylphosphatase [Cytophagales bacterium]
MELRHINITVSGKVQGVFYRASAKQKADEWGVRGFVRNERNGDVYLEAEAPEEILYKFIKWCNLRSSRQEVDKSGCEPGNLLALPILK